MIGYALLVLSILHWVIECQHPPLMPSIQIANTEVLDGSDKGVIYQNGKLNELFNDTIFRSSVNCRNDNLQIIVNNISHFIKFSYANMPELTNKSIRIELEPNQSPKPFVSSVATNNFVLDFNCSAPYYAGNYFNQVKVYLFQNITFSFLLNCDPGNRHKQFQVGYILLSIINAAIIIGVAMFSHVWSIRINLKPLRFELKWIPFLIFSIAGNITIILLLQFGYHDSGKAFVIIRYFGVALSIPFLYLCLNEIFYLLKSLRSRVFKFIRWCDIISSVLGIIIGSMGFIFENWIFYDFLAGFICVGSIKLFHFKSLKEAYTSMIITFLAITVLTIILHFLLTLSYNDYAGELSSPLFLQVPDLVENLFKKCSWLPILDVIIPGVTLSYLRLHDENKSSKCGGIYTVTGNLTFVIATIIWILLEYVYPYSVPFSLVTYPLLMLSIFIVAWRRLDWPTLYEGKFHQQTIIDNRILEENRKSFSDHVSSDQLESLLIGDQEQHPNRSNISTD